MKNQDEILIYPNPIKDFATIEIKTEKSTKYTIYISDLQGKIIKSQYIGSAKKVIFKNKLEAGTYIMKFIDDYSKHVITKKIIIL